MATNNLIVCSIPGCGRVNCVRGLCQNHYMRLRRKGTTDDRPTPEARFWALVERRGPDECWPWRGWTNKSGHGQFMVTTRRRLPAHVFAWMLHNGPLPADKPQGLHRCDNPPCCNPAHVFPGTYRDNVADRHAKRRDARGDRHGMTKIPESGLRLLHERIAAGDRLKDLAVAFGVATVTISKIKQGLRRQRHHPRSVP